MAQDVTQILLNWADGDKTALDRLMPLIYWELRRIARRHMNREYPGHTLQSGGLVNEAYLRLIDQTRVQWKNRAQFYAIATQLMRRILVDHARGRGRTKRGGDAPHEPLSEANDICREPAKEIIALDQSLSGLKAIDQRKALIVELRYFVGLSVQETAELLELSPRTVMREWNVARAWLYRDMAGTGRSPNPEG
jgi:RNA polymerase sigma factor (TIGR02999 family)